MDRLLILVQICVSANYKTRSRSCVFCKIVSYVAAAALVNWLPRDIVGSVYIRIHTFPHMYVSTQPRVYVFGHTGNYVESYILQLRHVIAKLV